MVAWGGIECPLVAPSSLEFCEASKKLLPLLLQAIFDHRSTPNHRPKTSLACSLAAARSDGYRTWGAVGSPLMAGPARQRRGWVERSSGRLDSRHPSCGSRPPLRIIGLRSDLLSHSKRMRWASAMTALNGGRASSAHRRFAQRLNVRVRPEASVCKRMVHRPSRCRRARRGLARAARGHHDRCHRTPRHPLSLGHAT